MKRLQDQTLYEILEVAPAAPGFEIETAYARAKELYAPGSLATYTLMDPEEAAVLTDLIDEAGRVLLDAAARARYDATLAASTATAGAAPPAAEAAPAEARPSAAEPGTGDAPVIIPALSLARAAFDHEADADEADADEADDADGATGVTGVIEAAMADESPRPLALEEVDVEVEALVVESARDVAEIAPATLAAAPEPGLPEATPTSSPGPALVAVPASTGPAVEPIASVARLLADAAAAGGPAEAADAPARTPIPLRDEVPAPAPPPEPVVAAPPLEPPPLPPVREAAVVVPEGTAWTGDVLRQIREARGLTLKTLSERIKVTRHHIENIEGDRFPLLPAPVYLRGILMSLARELRLDGQKVARSYLDRASGAAGSDDGGPVHRR